MSETRLYKDDIYPAVERVFSTVLGLIAELPGDEDSSYSVSYEPQFVNRQFPGDVIVRRRVHSVSREVVRVEVNVGESITSKDAI